MSSCGQYLYSASFDCTVIKWHAHTFAEVRRYSGHTREVTAICLLAHAPTHTRTSDTETAEAATRQPKISGKQTFANLQPTNTSSPHKSAGEQLFATSSADGTIRIWHTHCSTALCVLPVSTSANAQATGANKPIKSIAFSDDGSCLCVCTNNDKVLRLWSRVDEFLSYSVQMHIVSASTHVNSSAVSHKHTHSHTQTNSQPSTHTLSASADFLLSGHTDSVNCVCFIEKCSFASAVNPLLSLSGKSSSNSGKQSQSSPVTTASTSTVLPSFVRMCASGSQDFTIRLWDLNCISASTNGNRDTSKDNSSDGPNGVSNSTVTLMATLKSHRGAITAIAYNDVTECLYSASEDGTAKIWCPFKQTLLFTLLGHKKQVISLCVSASVCVQAPSQSVGLGVCLFTGSMDGTMRVWDAHKGIEMQCISTHQQYGCSFTAAVCASKHSGRRLFAAHDGKSLKVWRFGHTPASPTSPASPLPVPLAGSASTAPLSSPLGSTNTSSSSTWSGHNDKVTIVSTPTSLSADKDNDDICQRVVSYSVDGTICVWNTEDINNCVLTHKLHAARGGFVLDVVSICAHPQYGRRNVVMQVTESLDVCVWNLDNGERIASSMPSMKAQSSKSGYVETDSLTCRVIRLSRDGNLVACACSQSAEYSGTSNTYIVVWETASRRQVVKFPVVAHAINEDGTVQPAAVPSQVSISGMSTRTPLTVDTATISNGVEVIVNDIRFSQDSSCLVVGAGNNVHVYNLSNAISGLGREGGRLAPELCMLGHTGTITALAYSGDDSRIASGQMQGNSAASIANGLSSIRIWDPISGIALSLCSSGLASDVNCLSFYTNVDFNKKSTPRLASASTDKTVCIWDADTGLLLCRLMGHSSPVLSVNFSEDGGHVISGGGDKLVLLWEAAT
jgi:WD40 repeat protein